MLSNYLIKGLILILYVVISFYVVNTLVPLIPVYKQGVSAAPVVVFFSIRVFSVQCFVYHCLSFSPFSFDHYMVLPFDIQNLITPLLYSNLSSVHNLIYHNNTIKQQYNIVSFMMIFSSDHPDKDTAMVLASFRNSYLDVIVKNLKVYTIPKCTIMFNVCISGL
jgi:hypothetical protein